MYLREYCSKQSKVFSYQGYKCHFKLSTKCRKADLKRMFITKLDLDNFTGDENLKKLSKRTLRAATCRKPAVLPPRFVVLTLPPHSWDECQQSSDDQTIRHGSRVRAWSPRCSEHGLTPCDPAAVSSTHFPTRRANTGPRDP